jgi:hypothetical protein
MLFKRYKEFINEIAGPPTKDAGKKKKKDPKDIESADPLVPPVDPEVQTTCPKCGSTSAPCQCYIDDYYNARTPQWAPRASIKKGKKKDE